MAIPKTVQSEQILEINLDLKSAAHVYSLFPDQFLNYDTKSRVVAKLGWKYKVEVSYSVSHQLLTLKYKMIY
jgi:hypothetical protein